jgi:hypothetical protein
MRKAFELPHFSETGNAPVEYRSKWAALLGYVRCQVYEAFKTLEASCSR